jgi:hypothetical protein
MIEAIERLGALYEVLGVWKPCQHYYEQAMHTAATVCPNSTRHTRLSAKLENLDATANDQVFPDEITTSVSTIPYFYLEGQDESDLNHYAKDLLCSFNRLSPFEFRRKVFDIIYKRVLPLKLAINLLSMAGWLVYERRAQYDEIEALRKMNFDDLVFDDPQEFFKFIDSFSIDHSETLLNFNYDVEHQNLIIYIKHHAALLIIPLGQKVFDFKACAQKIEDIMTQNKETLFGSSNLLQQPDYNDPEFKRAWWKKRQNLDAQLQYVASQVDSEWLSLFSVRCHHLWPIDLSFLEIFPRSGGLL